MSKEKPYEISVPSKNMHFAAFIGADPSNELLRYDLDTNCYVYKSSVPEDEWYTRHTNSCCLSTDRVLLTLRRYRDRALGKKPR